MRFFSSISKPGFLFKRSYSSTSKLHNKQSLYYECLPWTVPTVEKKLLQGSIEKGCRSFITKSSINIKDIYFTFNSNFDTSTQNLSLIHILTPPKEFLSSPANITQLLEKWNHELQYIQELTKDTSIKLDYLSINLPPQLFLNVSDRDLLLDTIIRDYDGLFKHLALDFNTYTFLHSPDKLYEDVEYLVQVLSQLFQKYPQIQGSTIASNIYTLEYAKGLKDLLVNVHPNIDIYPTEILRCHPRLPGQISPQYDYSIPHKYLLNETKSEITTSNTSWLRDNNWEKESVKQIDIAIDDFQKAVNQCYAIENVLLTRHKERASKLVDLSQVLLGHVLSANAFSQFNYPEEWSFIEYNQISSNLRDAIAKLGEKDSKLRDWTLLYLPTARYMLSSTRNLFEMKTLRHTRSAYEKYIQCLQSTSDFNASNSSFEHFHFELTRMILTTLQVPNASMSLAQIDPTNSNYQTIQQLSQVDPQTVNKICQLIQNEFLLKDTE